MANATDELVTDRVDPSLEALVPRRSRFRNLALGAAGVAVLVGAFMSPAMLRPSVVSESDVSGSWSALAPHPWILAVVELQADAWPKVDVQSVADLPGARVAGAWVLADGLATFDDQLDPGAFASGEDFLEAALAPGSLPVADALPRSLDLGETASLVILWEITDCSQLGAGVEAQVELKTVLGTTNHQGLGSLSAPGFDVQTLTESGICPSN